MYLFCSTIFFAFVNTGVKFLDRLPASEIVFFRGLITLVLCLYFIKNRKIYLWGVNKKLLILRGIFGTIALYSLFQTIKIMPLALATTFAAMNPIFSAIVFHVVLKEKSSLKQALFLLSAMAGVFFIKGFGAAPVVLSFEQLFWGLLLPSSSACAYACVRGLRHSDHPLVVIFYFPFVSTPLMAPGLVQEGLWPSIFELAVILIVGVCTQAAQYLMTIAFQKETASKIAIYNYAGIIWGTLIGYFLFHETLSWNQAVGIGIIVASLWGAQIVSNQQQDLSK